MFMKVIIKGYLNRSELNHVALTMVYHTMWTLKYDR